jgi:hypothetical protein
MDGAPFSNSVSDITTGNRVWFPIVFDETGMPSSVIEGAQTGTKADGTVATDTCNGWTNNSNAFRLVGDQLGGPVSWTGFGVGGCDAALPIICIEKDRSGFGITPGVSSGKLIFLSGAYFVGITSGTPDTFCRNSGPDPATRDFKALIATTTASAAANAHLLDTESYVTKDGIFVGTGAQIVTTGTLLTGAWEHADGTFPNQFGYRWTGAPSIAQPAMSAADNCSDWTSLTGTARVSFANDLPLFRDAGTQGCGGSGAADFLCVEQ